MFPHDESEFTTHIASALNQYVRGAACFTPGSTKQAIQHLVDSEQFFDLVKRISDSSVLALEIKVRRSGRDGRHEFPSFKPAQHRILCALQAAQVPLHYCYNVLDENFEHLESIEVLEGSNTAEPLAIARYFSDNLRHESLRVLVDRLGAGGDGASGAPALFSTMLNGASSRLGARRLLLAYGSGPIGPEFRILDEEDLTAIGEAIDFHLGVPMLAAQDLEQMDVEDLRAAFLAYAQLFRQSLDDRIEALQHRAPEQNHEQRYEGPSLSM